MDEEKNRIPELIERILELKEVMNMFLETLQGQDRHQDILNVAQVAKMLNCTTANIEQSKFIINKNPAGFKKHLYISNHKRQIPCHNIGKANYKYKKEDILAFLAGRRYKYNEETNTNEAIW